jgi:heme-degrading monooxygenase HmoA
MFARNVSMNLKPNTLPEFTRTFEKDVVPVLRQQKGFRDEITFSTPGSTDVIAISLWDSKENADTYNSNTYPQVLKTLDRVLDGAPKVRLSDVVHSTFHKIAPAVAA